MYYHLTFIRGSEKYNTWGYDANLVLWKGLLALFNPLDLEAYPEERPFVVVSRDSYPFELVELLIKASLLYPDAIFRLTGRISNSPYTKVNGAIGSYCAVVKYFFYRGQIQAFDLPTGATGQQYRKFCRAFESHLFSIGDTNKPVNGTGSAITLEDHLLIAEPVKRKSSLTLIKRFFYSPDAAF